MKTTIEIDNLTQSQKIALEDMLATWAYLGGIGASRWTCFYADGDGNFRPSILMDGKKPLITELLSAKDKWSHGELIRGEYRIDEDWIARRLSDQ